MEIGYMLSHMTGAHAMNGPELSYSPVLPVDGSALNAVSTGICVATHRSGSTSTIHPSAGLGAPGRNTHHRIVEVLYTFPTEARQDDRP